MKTQKKMFQVSIPQMSKWMSVNGFTCLGLLHRDWASFHISVCGSTFTNIQWTKNSKVDDVKWIAGVSQIRQQASDLGTKSLVQMTVPWVQCCLSKKGALHYLTGLLLRAGLLWRKTLTHSEDVRKRDWISTWQQIVNIMFCELKRQRYFCCHCQMKYSQQGGKVHEKTLRIALF